MTTRASDWMVNRICPRCGDMVAGDCRICDPRPLSPRKQRLHRVYHSARFKRLRRLTFGRDQWTCVDCGYADETRTGQALVADHVKPFDGPADPLAWELSNLATRCLECSGRKDGGRRYSSHPILDDRSSPVTPSDALQRAHMGAETAAAADAVPVF